MQGRAVVVVGGGPVGSFCTYELLKAGNSVTWVTGKDQKSSAGYGSAGYVAVGLGSPLPTYESLGKVARWTLEKDSPIKMHVSFILRHFGWLAGYIKQGRRAASPEGTSLLRRMGLESLKFIQDLSATGTMDVEFQKKGALMVYESEEKLLNHVHDLERMSSQSTVRFRHLGREECRQTEPGLSESVSGGILFEDDGWVNPMKLLSELRRMVTENGAQVIAEDVERVELRGGAIPGLTVGGQSIKGDEYVFAPGAASQKLLRPFGNFPVVAGWGHTVTLSTGALRIGRPVNFGDRRVALSQTVSGDLRVSGFFELAPTRFEPPSQRYDWLIASASEILPGVDKLTVLERWSGMRPCTPDGLPIIGRLRKARNAIVATGHCREGVTLAPAAARLVSGLVSGGTAPGAMDPLIAPSRFGL